MTTVAPELGGSSLAAGTKSLEIAGKSPRQLFWSRLRRDPAAMFGLGVIILLGLIAAFVGVISHQLTGHGPNDTFQFEMTDEFGIPRGPNGDFFFGADNVGRDLFVRVLYGARTMFLVAIVATAVSVVIGTFLGLVAGYLGAGPTQSCQG